MYGNVFYFANINKIGGIETMFWMLARKYGDRDITIVFKKADPKQLARLRELVRCVRFTGQRIECRRAFFNFTTDIIDFVDAEEYSLILHADYSSSIYKNLPLPVHPKISRYLAVSQTVANGFMARSGIMPEVVYNPFVVDSPKKILHLVSATRLSAEKGKARMLKLAEALDAAGVPWRWDVWTTDEYGFKHPNIFARPAKLDILDEIADADYLVQLSDTEGYSYSVVEALSVGTPVIVTDFAVVREMGIRNGVNGFVLPMDMKHIPIEEIYAGLPPFKYKPRADRWGELLGKEPETWTAEREQDVTVEAIIRFIDVKTHDVREPGERWGCSFARALDLEEKGLTRMV